MVGWIAGNGQRSTARQQAHPDLAPSTRVGGKSHRLAVRRNRREFFETGKIGKTAHLHNGSGRLSSESLRLTPERSEEILQDAFLKLFEHLKSFRSDKLPW